MRWICVFCISLMLFGRQAASAEEPARPISFELDVQPILTRLGCNAGACHGKSRGQNGFQLSLLGFYPDFDYTSLTLEARGRRVFPPSSEESLLLKKASGLLPHGGGKRLDPASPAYTIIRDWIAQGVPRRQPDEPTLTKITVDPTEKLMTRNATQQLTVTGHYSDQTTRDVTAWSAFQSNESALVSVDPNGLSKSGPIPGEAALMSRFMGQIAISTISIPLEGSVSPETYINLPRSNFIDGLVWDKLQRLGITPSGTCTDAEFLRRIYLDIIGRLPSSEEARSFLANTSSDKRTKLVDELLERPEFPDFWANKWMDLLRPNPYRVGIKATFNYDAWIRDQFRRNVPYDQFVRGLLTAQGSTWTNGAVTYFRDRREPDELTTITSQLFLGVRLECAKCHHHPFEALGQEDFYGLAAYFARIGHKGTGLSPPISGGEEMIFNAKSGSVKHPITGAVLEPKPLFGTAAPVGADDDPRVILVNWMTSPENQYFGQVMANRVWADLLGRGLVDPVDDIRATNPASNGPLLKALADDFRKQGFDIKKLIRAIATSHVYGLSAEPTDRNLTDTRNYSRHYRQRLRAETLLDAVCDVTQVPENFEAMPAGSRSTQIWSHRIDSLFLDSFGRPDPNQDPPCERTSDTTVVQALHLMNSPGIHRKVTSDKGRVADLAASDKTPSIIVEELYLLTYSRFPTAQESQIGQSVFSQKDVTRKQAIEDLLWALMNTPEFVFKN
jgi:hypothetical protein